MRGAFERQCYPAPFALIRWHRLSPLATPAYLLAPLRSRKNAAWGVASCITGSSATSALRTPLRWRLVGFPLAIHPHFVRQYVFVGHYGLALAAKRVAPCASLGVLILGAQLVDLIWPALLLAGIERVGVVPSENPFLRLSFEWYPWTHSLVTGLLWGALAGVLYAVWSRDRRAGLVVGGLVVSHWIVDFITHVPDLPLYPGGPVAGLGLWRSVAGTMIVEAIMFAAGVAVYAGATRAIDRRGRYGFWGLVAFLAVLYFANVYGPPPPNVNAVAWGALAGWLIPAFGWWVDRHRTASHA